MESRLDIAAMRELVQGLSPLNFRLYWTDFLGHLLLGYGAFGLAQVLPASHWAFWLCYAVAAFALYRAVLFTHEITHFRRPLWWFSIVWNVLCGIPLAIPSFLYYQSHFAHHRHRSYGTAGDGEYIPFVHRPRSVLVKYVVLSAFAPLLLIFRFLVLVPASYLSPRLRRWVVTYGSSLAIDLDYAAEPPTTADRREWRWQEWGTFFTWAFLVAATAAGAIPVRTLAGLLLLMAVVHVINALRTVAAHRFANDGGTMSIEAQYLDSVNLVGGGLARWIDVLAAPVGLRYHALHHLFPTLPYHALGEAHRRIVAHVAPSSSYHRANEPSMAVALWKLWRSAGSKVTKSVLEPA
jgi:fatty acid desaturase